MRHTTAAHHATCSALPSGTHRGTVPARTWWHQGFTLVELAVVIIIVSLLVGATLILGQKRIEQQKITSTKERLELIERALKSYAELNGNLPCPADPRLAPGAANFGRQAANAGSCTGGTPATPHASGEVVQGAIPTTTLALPGDVAFDAWGRKISYSVDRRYTLPNAVRNNHRNTQCGSIIVADENDSPLIHNGMFILISHGQDGDGAYLRGSSMVNISNPHAGSRLNARRPSFSNRFRAQNYYENPQNSLDRFDDIVVYRERKDWLLNSDRFHETSSAGGTSARSGWVYIPEYTLPSGKVVPAFEVMKYLASPDTNDQVQSTPNALPWNGLSQAEARKKCQALNGFSSDSLMGEGYPMPYDIISETQWLSIAHQAISDSRNWDGGCYGSDFIMRGHSDASPNARLAASSNDDDGYYLTGNSANDSTQQQRSQRRTMYLPNNAVLWDMVGNLHQYSLCDLDYQPGENRYAAGTYGDSDAYSLCYSHTQPRYAPYLAYTNTSIERRDYHVAGGLTPETANGKLIDLIPRDNSLRFHNYIGRVIINSGNRNTPILRSHFHAPLMHDSPTSTSANYGLFNVNFNNNRKPYTGFRCTYTPQRELLVSPHNIEGLDIWYDASDIDGDFIENFDIASVANDSNSITTAGAPCNNTDNICVNIWRNKVNPNYPHSAYGLGAYNATSRRLNGVASGTNANRPTLRFNAINGRPAVHFSASSPQWLDTHHGRAPHFDDDGQGYSFNGRTEYTIFAVANASNYDAIVAASHSSANSKPHAVIFPYNMANDPLSARSDYTFYTGHLRHNSLPRPGADPSYCRLARPLSIHSGCLSYLTSASSCTLHATNMCNFLCPALGGHDTQGEHTLSHNTPSVLTAVYKAGVVNGVAAYVNGALPDTANSVGRPLLDLPITDTQTCGGTAINLKLNIGMNRHDTSVRTIGDVAEILIYNRALSPHERIMVERYLSRKYDIEYKGGQ